MIRFFLFFLILIQFLTLSSSAFALELEYLNQFVLPHKMSYKKSVLGGLSGLYLDGPVLYAVSDDRGNINEPRIYEFQLTVREKEFKVEPQGVIFLTVNESALSHKSTKSKSRLFSKVLDLEGLSMTPWGDFLLVNEGDCNHKPRVNPQLFSVKKDGIIQKEFEVPSHFLPEPSGEQKTGVQNNLAFESVTLNPSGKEWMV
ncbi:MAG: esterase-like activity of phytase family protein, partial [Pseudobdellovibrionaceae bacterium]